MIWRPDEALSLMDFDDMAEGPAVQDLWMRLPGRLHDSASVLPKREIDIPNGSQ